MKLHDQLRDETILMEEYQYLRLVLLVVVHLAAAIQQVYDRDDFPTNFVFGSGTSAPQYEGATLVDGRTLSIWDTFALSGRMDAPIGDVALDGYHKYKGDIKLMVDTNLDAFRISISWSRLIPQGRGHVNPQGLQYYNNVIDELITNGIRPYVTLNHLDLPQVLEDEYKGWLSLKIVKDFVQFADVCFREFGDRVLDWTTLNEVNIASLGGYNDGFSVPGRCSNRSICPEGDSSTEPYIVTHNMLLSHSAATNLYKEKYQATQKGIVGLNVYSTWYTPDTNSTEDADAAQRMNDIFISWIIDPLVYGDYADALKKYAGTRLPTFSKSESKQIKGAFDFIGVNHYSTQIVKALENKPDIRDFYIDVGVEIIDDPEGLSAPQSAVRPWAFEASLEYLKQAYGNPPIYIQENGARTLRSGILNDTSRVEYLHAYIGAMLDAIRNGSNIKGYFVWTFLDCLEIINANRSSFGLYYVDFDDKNLSRYQKLSAIWYSNFLKGKNTMSNVIIDLRNDIYLPSQSQL